jgi:hypothetical protein
MGDDARATSLHETDDWTVHYSAPHPPRKSSPVYVRTHHDLVYVKLTPCWVCGLIPNHEGKFDDKRLVNETHHAVVEEAAFMGVDIGKVEADEPTWDWSKVDPNDNSTFFEAGDAESAMLVLCSVHHRAMKPQPDHRGILGVGVHHIPWPVFLLQRYVKPEYPLFVQDDSVPSFDPGKHLHPEHAKHARIAHAAKRAAHAA